MTRLLDPNGQPIAPEVIAKLREAEAGPTVTGVRPVISGSPADGLTPRRLAAIHRAAAEGDTMAAMELAEDIEERDLHYSGVLGTRRRQVAQLPIAVEAASDDAEHVQHADFVREWIKEGILEDALFDMLDAIGKGFSVHEIEWEVTPAGILPAALHYRMPRWFEVSRHDGETVMLRDLVTAMADPAPPGTGFAGGLYIPQAGLVPLTPHKYVVHKARAKSGILPRAGLARVAGWAWMYKAFTMRDWAVFVQNFGMPIRIGKYGPEASPDDRRVLWRAVSNIAGDCAAIIPRSMEIEFVSVEAKGASTEVYERRADFLDRQVSKAVLGQTQTTDATTGGHAAGRTHRLVQEDIERSDARGLSVTVSRQIAARIVAFNFPGYVSKGGRRFPRVVIGRPDELPLHEIVTAMQWLGPQGLTVEASELRDRMGFSEPEPGVDVVGGAPPPPPVPSVDPAHIAHSGEDPRNPGPGEPHPGQPHPGQPQPGKASQAPATLHSMMAALRPRTVQPATVDPELLDRLQQRVELDAQGALTGLTDQVRAAIEEAADLADLQARLDVLQLDPTAFAAAMQRGIAIAHLVGQAALLDELRNA